MYGFNSDFHKLGETETMAMGNEKIFTQKKETSKTNAMKGICSLPATFLHCVYFMTVYTCSSFILAVVVPFAKNSFAIFSHNNENKES